MPVELYVGSIALVPIILGLVQGLKAVGMPVKYAPWANIVLSCVGFALVLVVWQKPEYMQAVTWGLNILVIFLGAAGLYDRTEHYLKR